MKTRKQIWRKNAPFNGYVILCFAFLSLSVVSAGQFAIVWFIGALIGNEIVFRNQLETTNDKDIQI